MPIGDSADMLLFRGSKGPPVAELQRRLKYGYTEFAGHLDIDGVYGPQTEAALRLRILPRGQLRLVAHNEPDSDPRRVPTSDRAANLDRFTPEALGPILEVRHEDPGRP